MTESGSAPARSARRTLEPTSTLSWLEPSRTIAYIGDSWPGSGAKRRNLAALPGARQFPSSLGRLSGLAGLGARAGPGRRGAHLEAVVGEDRVRLDAHLHA